MNSSVVRWWYQCFPTFFYDKGSAAAEAPVRGINSSAVEWEYSWTPFPHLFPKRECVPPLFLILLSDWLSVCNCLWLFYNSFCIWETVLIFNLLKQFICIFCMHYATILKYAGIPHFLLQCCESTPLHSIQSRLTNDNKLFVYFHAIIPSISRDVLGQHFTNCGSRPKSCHVGRHSFYANIYFFVTHS